MTRLFRPAPLVILTVAFLLGCRRQANWQAAQQPVARFWRVLRRSNFIMINNSLFSLAAGAAFILTFASCGSAQQNEIMLKVYTTKPEARTQVETDKDTAIVEIFSESGIGSATIEVTSKAVPKKILMRFHLRGLEELRFQYDEIAITASLSRTNARQTIQSFNRAGERPIKETAIAADSPYWLRMRVLSSNGAPARIPLQHGYIEAEAPEHFLKGGYRQAAIHWIDFYR